MWSYVSLEYLVAEHAAALRAEAEQWRLAANVRAADPRPRWTLGRVLRWRSGGRSAAAVVRRCPCTHTVPA